MSGGDMRDDHDPALSALYARLPREEPPAALDAAILSAARAASRQPPSGTTTRWGARLALVATLLLSTSVMLMRGYAPEPRRLDESASVELAGQGAPFTQKMEIARSSPEAASPASADALAAAPAPMPAAPPVIADNEVAAAARSAAPAAAVAPYEPSEPIAAEILGGADAGGLRPGDGPRRWWLRTDGSVDALADRTAARLRETGFAPGAPCPGVRWSGTRAGWRAELRAVPGAVELRFDPADAPCAGEASALVR